MNAYPEGHLYEALYAKYIHKRPVTDLVDRAGDIRGKRVLDICCGTGRLMKECIARGATVVGVDASADMTASLCKWLKENAPQHFLHITNIGAFLMRVGGEPTPGLWTPRHDVVFCRQAVNYWLYAEYAALLARCIAPGGKFIFNTFSKEPSEVPVVKEYEFQEDKFVEVSWREADIVHHVQIREGLPPHTTKFRWIPPSKFKEMLSPHFFSIEVVSDGGTDIYICTRKEDAV